VNLATGVAYVDGRMDGRARVGRQAQAAGEDGRCAQTGCGRGRRQKGRYGTWLTAGGQAIIVACCTLKVLQQHADIQATRWWVKLSR